MELDKKTKINIIISRFIEIFLLNLILTVIVSVLGIAGIILNQWVMIALLAISLIVFNFVNIGKYRWSYVNLAKEKDYYSINIIAYLLFALLNILCIYILPNSAYTWLFLITKFERFVFLGVVSEDSFWCGLLFSAITFHVIGIIAIICAPFGLDWISDDEAPEDLKMLETEENGNNENNDNEKGDVK